VALAAVAGAQSRDEKAWCAWLDPEGSLYAPGAHKAGVDLARMLVVQPSRKDLARVAVKLAASRAFDVIVIDYNPPALVPLQQGRSGGPKRRRAALRPEVLMRKLALLAEEGGSTIIVLTDKAEPRPMQWPVALRVELSRAPGALTVKVVKDRLCRLSSSKIAWPLQIAG
jgi:RecA/RadA recombinase